MLFGISRTLIYIGLAVEYHGIHRAAESGPYPISRSNPIGFWSNNLEMSNPPALFEVPAEPVSQHPCPSHVVANRSAFSRTQGTSISVCAN